MYIIYIGSAYTTELIDLKRKTKAKRKTAGKTKTIKKTKIATPRQTGKMKSRKIDLDKHARKTGRRTSRLGNIYYEYRKNRSDLDPEKGI